MDLREYKKWFSTRSAERKTEEDRKIYPISEGLSALHSHGSHGPEGEPSSHLGGRRRKKKRGGLSPHLSQWRRSAVGARIVMVIYINNLATFNTNSLPLYVAV